MKLTGNLRAAENVAVAGEIYCHNGFLFLVIKVDPRSDVCSCIKFDHRGDIETVLTMDREQFRNAPFLGHTNLNAVEIDIIPGRSEENSVNDTTKQLENGRVPGETDEEARERREKRIADMMLVTPSPSGRS